MTIFHASRGFWSEQLLIELEAPVNAHTMSGILAWIEGEGTKARNNPLATTRASKGSTAFNKAGVRNYDTFSVGMRSTIATIHLPAYTHLRSAIYAGKSGHEIARQIEASVWGTHHVPIDAVLRDMPAYEQIMVPS